MENILETELSENNDLIIIVWFPCFFPMTNPKRQVIVCIFISVHYFFYTIQWSGQCNFGGNHGDPKPQVNQQEEQQSWLHKHNLKSNKYLLQYHSVWHLEHRLVAGWPHMAHFGGSLTSSSSISKLYVSAHLQDTGIKVLSAPENIIFSKE